MGKSKQMIKNFTKYRFLLTELVKKNIKLKYRRSYLGILWTLVEPLLQMIVLTLVFGSFFGRAIPGYPYPVYVLTGRLLFGFFSSSTKGTLKAVSGNASMIKKVYVPKYMYVLSSVISNFITFLISLLVLLGVSVVLKVSPTIYLLQAWIPIVILLVMTTGIGMILATLSVFFRDVEYIWQVFTMLIMYASAIFYQVDKIVKRGNDWVFGFNPIYMCIHNFRNTVLFGCPMDQTYLIRSSVFAVVVFVIGAVLFYKKQDKFILYI